MSEKASTPSTARGHSSARSGAAFQGRLARAVLRGEVAAGGKVTLDVEEDGLKVVK